MRARLVRLLVLPRRPDPVPGARKPGAPAHAARTPRQSSPSSSWRACLPAALILPSLPQASKDSVTVKIQVNPGPFGVSLANYKVSLLLLKGASRLWPAGRGELLDSQ